MHENYSIIPQGPFAEPKSAAKYAIEMFESIMTRTTNYKIHLDAKRAIKRLKAVETNIRPHR